MIYYNGYIIPDAENIIVFNTVNEIPINRYGVVFIIEKELMNGNKSIKDFPVCAQFELLHELLSQSLEAELTPLANLLGLDTLELRVLFDSNPYLNCFSEDFNGVIVEEIILYFSEELFDICQFVRKRMQNKKEYIFADKAPRFAVSFDPYPCFDSEPGELH